MNNEEKELLQSLGIDGESALEAPQAAHGSSRSATWKDGLAVAATATLGAALALNVTILMSLPSVVRGRGAPFLPSRRSSMDGMFKWLKSQPDVRPVLLQGPPRPRQQQASANHSTSTARPTSSRTGDDRLKFVDLGSGDGRWVLRAASQHSDLFKIAVGYEINPLLHLCASARRVAHLLLFAGSEPACATELRCQDLWTVSLHDANVVAVYGLGPIMKELGAKLERELPPGSYVLSNVFSVPGWEPVATSRAGAGDSSMGASATYYIYRMPHREALPSVTSQ